MNHLNLGTAVDELFWNLVYAHNCLEYVKQNYPEVYVECGGDTFYQTRKDIINLQITTKEHL